MPTVTERYASCIRNSERVRWDIEHDVIRGRLFDFGMKFLPDGLSKVDELGFLPPADQRLLSQVQGRTYANMFALVERFIGNQSLALGRAHCFGDQVAFEALVRLTDEELKHQALFRRLDAMMAGGLPPGYAFLPQADEVAQAVLSKGSWAVLALTLDIELFSQAHYRSSIEPDGALSPLWKDVFRYHWLEEAQHAVIDELEWRRIDAACSEREREQGVDEFIELVQAVDAIVRMQADADAFYFIAHASHACSADEAARVHALVLKAYRWQYIFSGAGEPRFAGALASLTTAAQRGRIARALQALAD